MNNLSKEELIEIISQSSTKQEFYKGIGFSGDVNSSTRKRIYSIAANIGVDIDKEFRNKLFLKKECPICSNTFEVSIIRDKSRPKVTCSTSCANTHFRSGENNPNFGSENYRHICFTYHDLSCIICGENNIVEVHHYDENHENNDVYNLIPMCPTHHQYFHSKFRYLVEDKINEYRYNLNGHVGRWKNQRTVNPSHTNKTM